ncbi:MAG: RluA family pseudouridine synthase [Halobacteriovoraceae bacterium]|nr:RluA family pseudouridine synthase [Halobacteriovoraceae bacterium]
MTEQKEFSEQLELKISEDDRSEKRLDSLLVKKLKNYSRSYIKKLFLEGFIESDSPLSLSKMPAVGSEIFINIPYPEDYDLQAENIPIEILYEDRFLIFVNKPAGMVVHPAPGNWSGTLVNALLHHCRDLSGIGNEKRPGIVHRLDKGTSGVMVVAKEQKTHEKLVDIFKKHTIERQYLALCLGEKPPVAGTIKTFFSRHPTQRTKMTSKTKKGKEAITRYKVLQYFDPAMLMELTLETGRTHQIRVHLSEQLRCPIINDATYGNPPRHLQRLPQLQEFLNDYPHPLLHAKRLALTHPQTKKLLDFSAEPPEIFQNCLNSLMR